MLANMNEMTGERATLAKRLGSSLYTVDTMANGMSKTIYLNGFHKYAILLVGMKHVNGEKLINFERLGSAYNNDASSAMMTIQGMSVAFSFNAIRALGDKLMVSYRDMEGYNSYNPGAMDLSLTFAGWDAFGMFVAEFMMDPTSYVPGLAQSAAAAATVVATEDGSDVADMGRFAHINFDD